MQETVPATDDVRATVLTHLDTHEQTTISALIALVCTSHTSQWDTNRCCTVIDSSEYVTHRDVGDYEGGGHSVETETETTVEEAIRYQAANAVVERVLNDVPDAVITETLRP